jgi:DMSO/TMAO reductase YedYZ molybdopterin-dependent catalytic subunit
MKLLPVAAILIAASVPAMAEDMGGMKMDGMAMKAPAVKSLSVKLDGKVKMPANFTLAQLKALPAVTVETNFADQGKESWKGASLMAILEKAGTVEEKGGGAYLQHLIVARGTDGYGAGIAIGEMDAKFAGKTVIIAYEKDGKPLDSLRLIVSGDAHAGRGVRDLAEITVN